MPEAARERSGGATAGRIAASVLVSLLVLWYLRKNVQWQDVQFRLYTIDWWWASLAATCTLATLLARSMRLRVLLGAHAARHDTADFVGVASFHQAIFTTLPSGLGDLALPFLARTCLAVSPLRAGVVLAFLRVQDLVVLVGVAAGSAILLARHGLLATALASLVLLAALVMLSEAAAVMGFAARVLGGKVRGRFPDLDADASRGPSFAATLVSLVPGSAGGRASAFWTALSWLTAIGGMWAVLNAFGLGMSPLQAGAILCGLNLAGAMAVVTFAGIGFADAGLFAMLRLFGVPPEAAIQGALAVRVVLLSLNVALPAVIGAAVMFTRRPSGGSSTRS